MSVSTDIKLNTGATIPAIGLGTWQAKPGEVQTAVAHALKSGYKHLDCALCYQNEDEVGQGIKESGVKREDIFITSKVRTVENGTVKLFPVKEDGSRNIDWEWDQADTWKQMEALLATGKVKAIGVSNCSVPLLEKLEKTWKVVPAANQVEIHPYNPELELYAYCKSKGIVLEAYSPLGSTGSPLSKDPELLAIAEKYKVTPATILISWHVNNGVVVLPKSVTPSRIESNLNVVKLEQSDIQALNKMAEGGKQQRINTPPWGTDFGFPHWYGPGNKNAPENARLIAGKS